MVLIGSYCIVLFMKTTKGDLMSQLASELTGNYFKAGFVAPQRFVSEETACKYKNEFFKSIGQDPLSPEVTNADLDTYHARFEWALKLASNEIILNEVSKLLGSDDILLWANHFWYKAPHTGQYVPWHQDAAYWPIEPKINVTAWLALEHSVVANGCLRIIPGTQNEIYGHHQTEDTASIFSTEVDRTKIDESMALDVIMKPGEFVLFNENTLHGSKPNTSDMARVACSCRYTVPSVKLNFKPDDHRIKVKVVRGVDRFGHNDHFKF